MKYLIIISTVIGVFTACVVNEKSSESIEVEFDSSKTSCVGIVQRFCLQSTDGQLWYNSIDGFNYRWGYKQKIRVIEREIDNPATDQSSVEYIYEELVSQTEDSVGTIYLINDITELDFDIQGDYSDIIIFEESFQCESRSVCEELRDSYTTDKKIQLEFKYLGNGIIALNRFYYK